MNQQFRMAKQVIDMQKASFDGMINSLISMWDQTGGVFESAAWLPEEGKKALKQWVDVNRKACENLKSVIDNGYANLDKILEGKAQQE
jgi:hypothetical protein